MNIERIDPRGIKIHATANSGNDKWHFSLFVLNRKHASFIVESLINEFNLAYEKQE